MKKITKIAIASGRIFEEIVRQVRYAGDGEDYIALSGRVWKSLENSDDDKERDFCHPNWHKMVRAILDKLEQVGLIRFDGARYFLEPQTMEVEL